MARFRSKSSFRKHKRLKKKRKAKLHRLIKTLQVIDLGKYRYSRRKGYFRQGVEIFLGLIFGSLILFVAPEAWWPLGIDNVPNFWSGKPLVNILLEEQMGFYLLGLFVVLLLIGKMLYDTFK